MSTPVHLAPRVGAPGAIEELRSADPVAVDQVNGVPQHVRVTLSWRAPARGGVPAGYRIHCTLMQGSSAYDGPR